MKKVCLEPAEELQKRVVSNKDDTADFFGSNPGLSVGKGTEISVCSKEAELSLFLHQVQSQSMSQLDPSRAFYSKMIECAYEC